MSKVRCTSTLRTSGSHLLLFLSGTYACLKPHPTIDYLRPQFSPSLAKYHTHLLTLQGPGAEGRGRWTLTRHGSAEERMERDREIVMLEERLNEVENWERRVKELDMLLHTTAPREVQVQT